MSLFGTSSTLNADIEKTTSENNTTENWGLILDICDRVNNGSATPKDCLKCIIKRLNSLNPHVVMKAITLLDACVNNCGKQFHLEVASREFETEFKKLLQKSQPKVNTKLKLTLKRWAEDVFKSDPQLDLIPSLYKKLREEGHDFSDPSATPKRETTLSKDPNVVSSQQEEDDIAKAIELSLKEVKNTQSPKMMSSSGTTATSLYPSALLSTAPVVEPRKVRALYDFEAAEDNELTFQAGEIIMVLDDSDPNWWKGQNQRGEGLFPSNFVTADLSVEPESLSAASGGKGAKKSVQFSDEQKLDGDKDGQQKQLQLETVEINEEKIDRLLHLIHEADPEDPSQDTEEMLQLEQLVNQMGPMIDAELERVDRKHAQLTQLSSDLVDAINLYHNLMREPDRSAMMSMGGAAGGYAAPGGYVGGPMNPMYGMPAMYQSLPGVGMYPMAPGGPPSMPGGQPMPGYNMAHLRHDMSQMNVGTMQQFPTPQQQQPPQTAMHHHHQPHPAQGGSMQTVSQNGPTTNGMLSQVAPTTSLAGVGSQQSTTTVAPQTMPNMTGGLPMPPQHGAIPQGFANPTSPPPVGMAGPSSHHQLQQAPPNPNQHSLPQMRPTGQPPVSYPSYVPQQPQQQTQPAVSQPVQQNVASQGMQPGVGAVPVTGGPPTTSTQPVQPNLNHHHHPAQHIPMNMQPNHFPPASGVPPTHQQQQQFMPQMGPPMGNFAPMGGPMNMFPPGGPGGVGGPLSINTNHPGPQNIPIYQQQR
ncbi:signal transducing adapter molecule 1 [Anopheles marshallii]|uniref:signal transducing adapter molecule 1 n=1 Tax=Anopheles marshallii TaxID=1521116 RepID=UPI00237B6910|nr:signal transducing adapter molecule 1 [Anopheles marshallii]